MSYEEKAIAHIRQKTGDMLDAYDDDQLVNIIDIIWDWQEDNGFLEIDADIDDEDDIDVDALVAHTARLLAKDKGNLVKTEHLKPIIEAELEFSNTFDGEL